MKLIHHPVCEWQKPVLTELYSYELLKANPLKQDVTYVAAPWATLIDKLDFGSAKDKALVKDYYSKIESLNLKNAFTICQHDRFHKILPTLKRAGINTLFASHMVDGSGFTTKDFEVKDKLSYPYYINGIRIETIFLYPVNIGNPNNEKDVLYSFIGSYGDKHISDIRRKIFSDNHSHDSVVLERKGWQFDLDVYQEQILENSTSLVERYINDEKSIFYKEMLSRSRFSLCPSGTGPSSIRFLESLGSGAIPVILADKMMLPKIRGINWKDCTIKIAEKDYNKLNNILREITSNQECELRKKGLKAYKKCSAENFIQNIREYYEFT